MATTQIRLQQLTGSIGTSAGQVNDATSAAVATAIPHANTQGLALILSHMASSIKRIHGDTTFSEATAGTFSQTLLPATDDTYDLGSAAAAWQDLFLEGDITMTDAGTIATSAGDLTLDSAADIVVDAAGNDVIFKTGGTESARLTMDSTTSVELASAGDIILDPVGGNVLPGSDSADSLGSTTGTTTVADDFASYVVTNGTDYSSTTTFVSFTSLSTEMGDVLADDTITLNDGSNTWTATVAAAASATATKASAFGSTLAGTTLTSSTSTISPYGGGWSVALMQAVSGDALVIGSWVGTVSSAPSSTSGTLGVSYASGADQAPNGGLTTTLIGDAIQVSSASGTLDVSAMNGGQTVSVTRPTSAVAWANLYVDNIDLNAQGSISMGGTGRIDLDADDDTSIRASADDVITIEVGGADKLDITSAAIHPESDALMDLGTSAIGFNDLHLGSGGVVNFDGGDVTMTHSSNAVTVAGGTLATAALTTSTIVASGIIKTDDSTAATSTTDGSLQTDGGLSVALDAVVGDDLILLSDASVVHFGADKDVTLTHVHNAGLTITHIGTGDNLPVILQLKSEEDAVIADEVIASLEFAAGDSDGTDGATVAAGIHAIAEETFAADANATKLVFTAADSETAAAAATAKMTLASTGNLTTAGSITAVGSFIIGSADMNEADLEKLDGITNGTAAASKAVVLDGSKNIATIGTVGCGAITSTGTSSLGASTLASLTCTAAATFGGGLGSSGATITTDGAISADGRIVTDDTTAATSTTDGSLQTDGGLSVALDAVVGDDLILLSENAQIAFGADSEVTLAHVPDSGLLMASAVTAVPVFELKNTNADALGATLKLNKNGSSPADGDVCGNIDFASEDDASNAHTFARINATIDDASSGAEQGGLDFYVAEYDGTLTKGLQIQGTTANGVIDVTLGAGAASTTTVAGNLTVSGTTTTVNSTVLTVADDLITVSKGNDTVANADGSGMEIDVTGGTNLYWKYVHSNTALSSNVDIDAASGKAYKIAGTSVLNATTLGAAVVASSLTSLGTIASLVATTADINAGTIDNATIGAATHTTGKFTTVDATTDFTIDGLVLTADTITNDAALTVVSTGLTLNASLDIALSADGGNVTMDDGSTTIFDFNVDDTTLTIHDDQDTGDKVVMTMAQHGAFSIVTTDDDAAAANIQITADGTVDIDSAGLMTLDSGGNIALEPAGGSHIKLDDVIQVDSGVIIGATSITSTAFVGGISGGTVAGSTGTFSGILKTDDSTAATSTTDGSLQTDGGLSVVLDAVIGDDLMMLSDASVIHFGADKDVTLTHVADVGLTITHTGAGDNLPVILQLKSEEDAVIADEVIASLEFAAGDSDGSDGALVAAGIHAIAEETFAADANATKLVFTAADSETAAAAATAKMTLASTGNLTTAGSITAVGSFIIGSADMNEADLEKLDGITNGTAAASKAVVLDGSKNIATIGTVGCGAITSTGSSSFAQGTFSGRVIVDDTTAATTTTDGSLQTDGGLSVALDAVIGDDLMMLSDAAVVHFGADKDVTLTHVHNAGFLLNSTRYISFQDAGTKIYSSGDGVLDLASDGTSTTAAMKLTSAGGISLTGGDNNDSIYVENSPLQFEQISAPSSTTDKLYNVSGTLYFNGTALSSTAPSVYNVTIGTGLTNDTSGTLDAGDLIVTGDWSTVGGGSTAWTSSTALNKIQVYVNGQLQRLHASSSTHDAYFTGASKALAFSYDLILDDVVQVIVYV